MLISTQEERKEGNRVEWEVGEWMRRRKKKGNAGVLKVEIKH